MHFRPRLVPSAIPLAAALNVVSEKRREPDNNQCLEKDTKIKIPLSHFVFPFFSSNFLCPVHAKTCVFDAGWSFKVEHQQDVVGGETRSGPASDTCWISPEVPFFFAIASSFLLFGYRLVVCLFVCCFFLSFFALQEECGQGATVERPWRTKMREKKRNRSTKSSTMNIMTNKKRREKD
jgi:hypothetical protein